MLKGLSFWDSDDLTRSLSMLKTESFTTFLEKEKELAFEMDLEKVRKKKQSILRDWFRSGILFRNYCFLTRKTLEQKNSTF